MRREEKKKYRRGGSVRCGEEKGRNVDEKKMEEGEKAEKGRIIVKEEGDGENMIMDAARVVRECRRRFLGGGSRWRMSGDFENDEKDDDAENDAEDDGW